MASMAPTAEQLFEKISSSRWTPIGVNVAALLLLSYSLTHWAWRLAEPAAPLDMQPVVASVDSGAELRQLIQANLFGQVDIPIGTVNLSPNTIPLTSLNLTLSGVIQTGGEGFAILSVNGAPDTAFGVGEQIQSGVSLQAVYADRAILRRNGMLEAVLLKEESGLAEGSVITPPPGRPSSPVSGIQGNGNNYTVERNTLTQQMQRPEFLSQAMMVPNAGGGFLVREIQPGSVYEKLGLRQGDVIRSVNGQPINNMEEVMKLYQQLGGINQVGNISIEIMRGGRTESLQYNLQ